MSDLIRYSISQIVLDEFLHTENFVLIDKNKHIRGIYNGLNKASVNQLIKDVKTLKSM